METEKLIKNMRRLDREELMSTVLAALDNHLPCHGYIWCWSLVTVDRKFATERRESLMGTPR